jgi:LytS/YehU family sensor histidine kinase
VDLQRLRKDDHYKISFKQENTRGFTIAPLLLIPFVENAFKYVSHQAPENRVDILMKRNGHEFSFHVFNTRDWNVLVQNADHGIGLKNVKRRLELLYPGRHQLVVDEKRESFSIDFTLVLN